MAPGEATAGTGAGGPTRESHPKRAHPNWATLATQVTLLGLLVLSWELTASRLDTGFWTSSPIAIVRQLQTWIQSGLLWDAMQITLTETILGFALGVLVGSIVGFILGWWRMMGDVLEPILMPFYALPKVALAPLFVLWFGIGIASKVGLAALMVFFIVFFTTFKGTREVDRDLVVMAQVMGASRIDTWRTIAFPHAAVWMFSGLRLGLPYAFRGAVVGEFIASSAGLGFLIRMSSATFNTAGVFAGVLVLIVVAGLMLGVMGAVEKRTLRWQTASGHV